MKVIAFNGSPRKRWNTASLLEKTLEGAAAQGAETELVHLYDYTFKGCAGCFQCKRIGGPSYGKCAKRDDLTPILERAAEADVLILGSPIYLGSVTGEMRSFFERLVYPYYAYDTENPTVFPRKIRTAFIYDMGVNDERMKLLGYEAIFDLADTFLKRVFGHAEKLLVMDTLHFVDHTKYHAKSFDMEAKLERHRTIFPQDCQRAFDLGARLAVA